ncbi:MAG: GtrA family protein [Patescibacteria group bacterium]
MFKKDFVLAGVIGFITAVFATPILYYSNDSSWIISRFGVTFPVWIIFIILPLAEYSGYIIASKLFSHILALRQLGRFGITGLMNFCVDAGSGIFLSQLFQIDIKSNNFIPFLFLTAAIAIVNSYFWQRTWTFGEKTEPTRKEFIAFLVVTLVGLSINITATKIAIHSFSILHISNNAQLLSISKIAATAISLFWNFLGYKFFVFK